VSSRGAEDVPSALRVPAFAVIGGGFVGVAHVRQLLRAVAARRLETQRIFVVDRDPSCPAAREPWTPAGIVQLEVAEWSAWLARNLARMDPRAQLVPYHWAPHLLLGWIEDELRSAGFSTARSGGLRARGLPHEETTRAGDRALSHASWTCPPLCNEPALCPHTRGPRDWSLAEDLEAVNDFDRGVILRCLHLLYGVGTIPVGAIHDAREGLLEGARARHSRILVATSSHCHALASVLEVAAPSGAKVRPGPGLPAAPARFP
jgi:hypothetical protein